MDPDYSVSTSFSLLERSLAGDADSWTRLSNIYLPMIFGWVRDCGIQTQDANDITQTVFIKAYEKLGDFQHGQGRFRGWLWTITRNRVRDHIRQKSRRPTVTDPGVLDLVATPPWDAAETDVPPTVIVERALKLLQQNFAERTWRAAWQTIVDGRRPVDVAHEFQMSVGSVYTAKHRVVQALKELLADLEYPHKEKE